MKLPCFILFGLTLMASAADLAIQNHKDGDTLRYELALIKGTLPESAKSLTIQNAHQTEAIQAVVHNGKFKALVKLAKGKNTLSIKPAGADKELSFNLNYQPQTNAHFVRLVWMTDNTGDESYATPEKGMPQDYVSRLRTAGRLMQTFTAERMNQLGLGHRTFRLERDAQGEIIVHLHKGKHPAEHYYKLGDSGRYWNAVRAEMNEKFPDRVSKNIVLAAFTRKDPDSGKMRGHTALGGANLGLFGSASIFSWPSSIAEVPSAFLNDKGFDASRVHDDSSFRKNY